MRWSRWLATGEAWKVKGLAPAKAWAQAGGSTMGPRLSLLAHCEGEPQHHCDPFTPSSLWDKQEGRWILGAQWAGGLGAPVALGTPMAMAEWPPPEWASYHSPNTNNCQDLGNSFLLLLGLIVCINIGINMVTLLWHRLRGFLHQVFHIVCEKEACKSSSLGKQTQPRKQSFPAVHLRCTLDPVKMTVTPPPTRRHRHRGSSACRAHRPVAWAPDTDNDEKLLHQHPVICSHNWDRPKDWEGFQSPQGFWAPWAQDTVELPSQTIRFQQTIEERPLKREMRSELGLEAYVYPVNPPPPSPQALSHKNSGGRAGAGAKVEQEQCSPAPPTPPPIRGPAIVPDIPQRRSSGRIAYDARDVRRRLRELTREVEALSHCYPLASRSSTAEGMGKDWVYRSLTER
ncbi:spermatid maturation protein 1 [Equus quagga]|uniref:spermatid maturation protein 1 n=1 Tax=Equus quagga TaxID=89248 RepID=UPI001EE1ECD4|nr:spermatid maturation protein 1 [Equus quagga]